MPRSFQRPAYYALVFGAGAGAVVGKNFSVRGHKSPQDLRVFIVHGIHFIAAKIAEFFNVWLIVVVGWSHKIIDKNDIIDKIEQK